MRKMDTTIYTCRDERLPESAKGLRIAVLADIHNNRFGENDADLVCVTAAFEPDLILIPGDLIVGSRGERDYEPMLYLIRELRRIAPVFLSEGNHEERLACMEGPEKYAYEAFLGRIWELDGEMLINQSFLTDAGVRIYGLSIGAEYYRKGRTPKLTAEEIEEKLGKKDPETFGILMAHTPVYFTQYAAWGADLTVSGHLHGGLFRLPGIGGVISPQMHLFPKYDAGLYREGTSQMVVSRGLGSHHINLRYLGNAPEFVGIILDS